MTTPVYYRLLDPQHENVVVKVDDRIHYEHDPQRGWVRSGILLHYEWPESDTYGQYEEISEQKAKELISQK